MIKKVLFVMGMCLFFIGCGGCDEAKGPIEEKGGFVKMTENSVIIFQPV